jgi:hypothetical protein
MQTESATKPGRVHTWAVPVVCVLAAAGYAAVFLAHGKVVDAVLAAAVMLAYGGLLIALSRRSEIAALLRGTGRDERRALIDLRASALALYAVIILTLAMTFIELAKGREPGPWAIVAAVGGAAYLAGIVIFSRRT